MRKFMVSVWWNYIPPPGVDEKDYIPETCNIFPVDTNNPDEIENDGYNYVSGGGRDGYRCNIYDTPTDAFLNAGFNPKYINFTDLTEEETSEKDNLLSQYTWSYEGGLQKKE